MTNVTEFRPKSNALTNFLIDTEDDFGAIRLLIDRHPAADGARRRRPHLDTRA
jgi:hypothetical protein